jgi:hypothetical protein
MRRRIHASQMRRRIDVCHMRKRNMHAHVHLVEDAQLKDLNP